MPLMRWMTTGAAAIGVFTVAAFAVAASGPVDVSGLSPFAACTVGGPGTNYVNSEVEPFVVRVKMMSPRSEAACICAVTLALSLGKRLRSHTA